MKTGGTTFGWHVRANFRREQMYPHRAIDIPEFLHYWDIARLLALSEERQRQIRTYTGHFPFVVTDLLDGEFVRMTLLRDPVARTVSFLNHWKRIRPDLASLDLEEIYDTAPDNAQYILNHQSKQFAMIPADEPVSFLDCIVVDDDRLEVAKANLERVDLVGLQQDYDGFLAELSDRYGWDISPIPQLEASEETVVPASFRRRIERDNAADMAFYEYAVELHEQRARRRSSR
jgi:hypothetical protein